jgi:hypothetical protein
MMTEGRSSLLDDVGSGTAACDWAAYHHRPERGGFEHGIERRRRYDNSSEARLEQ